MTTDDKTPMLKAAVEATSQAIKEALDGPSAATGRPPRASEITLADVMDRIDVTATELRRQIDTIANALNDGAPGWSQAMAATNARLRSRLRRQVLAVAEDLERYASDLRPEKLPMSERKLAWTLRQIVAGEPQS